MSYLKKCVLSLLLAPIAANALADDVITLTTSKPIGEKITLMVNPVGEISISWGDDVFETYTTSDQPFRVLEGTVKGETITIKSADNRLTMLNCNGQQITSIDVSSSPNLRSLYCHNNLLEKIALSKASNLTDLDLSNNLFTNNISITTKRQPMLEYINIANNELTNNGTMGNFSFPAQNLQFVNISNNKFVKVNFQNADLFSGLYCANNRISSIDLSDNATTSTLYASNNEIKTVKLAANNEMQQFIAPNNKLTTLDLSGSANLKTLNVSNNSLTNINYANVKLQTLECDNNNLSFGSLPAAKYKPENYNIMPQAPLSIAGLMKKTENNVPYVDVCPSYAERNEEAYVINIGDYREGPGHSSSGVVVKAFRLDENGQEVELTKATFTAQDNEYSYASGKLTFFKPMTNVFIKLTNTTYSELELVTEFFCVGHDVAVGIDQVYEPNNALQIIPAHGVVTLVSNQRTLVNIFNLAGKKVWGGTVIGTQTIPLPKGVFIINGQKISINA